VSSSERSLMPVTGHVLFPLSSQRWMHDRSYVWPVTTITGSTMSSMDTGHEKCAGTGIFGLPPPGEGMVAIAPRKRRGEQTTKRTTRGGFFAAASSRSARVLHPDRSETVEVRRAFSRPSVSETTRGAVSALAPEGVVGRGQPSETKTVFLRMTAFANRFGISECFVRMGNWSDG